MRTTVDIPDDVLRRAKARAALDGLKLKDLITRYVEWGLATQASGSNDSVRPHRSPLPLIPEAMTGKRIQALSGEALADIELEEDIEKLRRSFGR